MRESDDDVSKNKNYRAGVVDRSEGRLASVGLIKVLEEDMADNGVDPIQVLYERRQDHPRARKRLGEIIRTPTNSPTP